MLGNLVHIEPFNEAELQVIDTVYIINVNGGWGTILRCIPGAKLALIIDYT